MEPNALWLSGRIRAVPFQGLMRFVLDLRIGQSLYAASSAAQIPMTLHGSIWQAKYVFGGP